MTHKEVGSAWRCGRGLLRLMVMVFGSMAMTGCDVSRNWTEEVRLADGSLIVIKRKMVRERFGEPGHPGRVLKQEIEYDKPGGAIRWSGDIDPLIFDLVSGRIVVVAYLSTGEECRRYGYPANQFMPYEFSNASWQPIQMKDLPDGLKFNLLRNAWNNGNQGLITLAVKHREDFNPPDWFKKFDKNQIHPCPNYSR